VGAGSVRAGCASGGGGDVSASGALSAVEQWIAMIRKCRLKVLVLPQRVLVWVVGELRVSVRVMGVRT
jgi:hypothetical protein